MTDLFGTTIKEAVFSANREYRYALIRIWRPGLPMVSFIGLNPSTANEATDDNTITKVQKIADHNGFGGLYMLNLFGIVSSNPEYIDQVADPVGHRNDHFIKYYTEHSQAVVACWGNFKQAQGRDAQVKDLIGRELSHLHINKNGSPKHPLYCRDNSIIIQPKPINSYANT